MITLTNNLLVFGQSGETQHIYLSSDQEWYVEKGYNTFWTIDPTTGTSGVTEIAVISQPTTYKQNSVIKFVDNDGTVPLYLVLHGDKRTRAEEITITPSSISFPATGGNINVVIDSPTPWSYGGSSTDWVQASPSTGEAGETTVVFTAEANTGASRSFNRLITWNYGEGGESITISQEAAAAASFGVSPTSITFVATGGTSTVSVTGVSQSWSLAVVGDGISVDATTGNTDAVVNVTVTPNTGSTVRTGYLNFTHGEDFKTVFLTQEAGAPASYFAISPAGGTFEQTGDTKTINVISNYPWTASTSYDFVTVSPTTGTGNGSVTISVPNNTGSSRNFTVVFTNSMGSTVSYGGTQGQSVKVTPSSARYAYTGESKTISVECDYPWTAATDANWFTFGPSTGNGDGTVTVQAQANNDTSVRYANITFTDDKGNTAVYQVVQDAYEPQAITITGLTDVAWSSQTQYWRASSNRTGTFSVSSSQDWCQITGLTQGDTGCTFYLQYGRNTGDQPRTTIITVSQGTGSTTASFTQGAASAYISVTPINAYITSASTSQYFSVQHSSDISLAEIGFETSGDLTPTSIEWNADKTSLNVRVPANTDNVSKALYITITGGTASASATLTQAAGSSLHIDVSGNTTVGYDTTSASFSATSNVQGNFTITSSNPSWCQVTGIAQDGYNCTFRLVFSSNMGVSNRTAVINVTQNGLTKSFTFTQQAYQGDHYIGFGGGTNRYVSWQGGTSYSNPIIYNGIVTSTITMTDGFSGNIPVTSCTFDGSRIMIEFDASTSFEEQSYTRTIRAQGTDGNYYSASFTFIQYPINYVPGPVIGSEYDPIWKEVILNPANAVNGYKILVDNEIVYAGKVYSIPGRDIDFRINDIARDFLGYDVSLTEGASYDNEYVKTVRIAFDGGNSYNYTFFNDWSYVEKSGNIISDPISPELPAGALAPFSFYSPNGGGGYVDTYIGSTRITGIYVDGSREYQSRYLIPVEEGKTYKTGDIEYKGVSACRNPYVLYYINAFGGLDAFMPQHAKMRTDNITSYEMNQRYHNITSDFAQKRYLVDVQPTWQFNTGWLTDEQSCKMHHLIESPLVYLYSLNSNTYTPVIITENSLQYKTFFNQGKKKVAYTFTVKESTTKQRR